MKLIKHALITLFLLTSHSLLAENSLQGINLLDELGMGGSDDILDVDDAFKLSTKNTDSSFSAHWQIADGHYLYRDKTKIIIDDSSVSPGTLQLPAGEAKDDPVFNKTLFVFHHEAEAQLPFQYLHDGDKDVVFKVKYQGCSEISGICYPPQTRSFTLKLSALTAAAMVNTSATTDDNSATQISEQDQIAQALRSGDTWLTLLVFFGAGLLLAFTPCVFPMIPILMGIIVGQGETQTVRKSFVLSLVYVLAMAATYTVVGILVGLSGENIQAWFQNPWIIGSFAAIFVGLSLSMFGFYELQMPASIQNKLTQMSNNQQGGTLLGVAIMGLLSALIVGPCVTAPLVGALIYIAETGDAVLGGMALFALSMGMGAPLLAIGASAGSILPKAGAWMDAVKAVFGVLLLALAIWLLERVTPAAYTIALWSALLIISGVYMGALEAIAVGSTGWRKLWKGTGLLLVVYGIILIIGLASGGRDLFNPLKGSMLSTSPGSAFTQQASHLNFRQIKGIAGLNAALADAARQNQAVMLDFYADWCVSCKEMEALTFSDPGVQQALSGVMLLQADVTPNDELDRALYKHFGIIGPPSIMFFDQQSKELRASRVVGFMKAEAFIAHLQRTL